MCVFLPRCRCSEVEYLKKQWKDSFDERCETQEILAKKWTIPHEFTAAQYLKLKNDLELAQQLKDHWEKRFNATRNTVAAVHADYKIIIDGLKESNEKLTT